MQPMYYIGLDVHKRKISCCVKESSGRVHAEGSISATRLELDRWMRSLPQPWSAAMEATMFTGWMGFLTFAFPTLHDLTECSVDLASSVPAPRRPARPEEALRYARRPRRTQEMSAWIDHQHH